MGLWHVVCIFFFPRITQSLLIKFPSIFRAIITPVLSLPLLASLWINQRKASKAGLLPEYPWKSKGYSKFLKTLWTELDVIGVLLLVAGFSLLLVPLTLVSDAVGKWRNPSIIAAIGEFIIHQVVGQIIDSSNGTVFGGACLIAFPLWEVCKKVAPTPLLTLRLFKDRTVMAGCVLGLFYFSKFISTPKENRH